VELWVGLAEAQLLGNHLADARASLARIDSLKGAQGRSNGTLTDRVDRLRARIGAEGRKPASG